MPIQGPHPEERRCQATRLEGWRSEWTTLKERPRVCGARSSGQARGLRVRFAKQTLARISVLRRPGGSSGGPEPVPIPNTAVKPLSADGTKSQGLEE